MSSSRAVGTPKEGFQISLTRGAEPPDGAVHSRAGLDGLLVTAAVFAFLAWAVLASVPGLPNEKAAPIVSVQDIGNALMTRYVLPLEIIAVLLTAATIGAVIVAMHEKARAK